MLGSGFLAALVEGKIRNMHGILSSTQERAATSVVVQRAFL